MPSHTGEPGLLQLTALELKVPPVVVVAVAAGAMWLAAWLLPALHWPFPGNVAAALMLGTAGVAASIAGVVEFRRARTTVNPLKPDSASSLVSGGIYRWTRNPMYLGFALALLGWAVFLANPAALAVLPCFIVYMNRFQIEPEERSLERIFGPAFVRYREDVRRWI
jgi:protein-S-isoprenylcysteine O-methyltransferase Ste14